jgi:hypothetical protein
MSEPEQWYWDLSRKRVVRAAERGLGANTLGPYDSKAEAENWHSLVEQRNERWDEDDEDWNDPDADD